MTGSASASTAVDAHSGVVDRTFRAMGCDVRIVAAAPDRAPAELAAAARGAEQLVHAAATRLTRFDPASELRRLDDAPTRTVAVSPLLAYAVATALAAASASDGLVDPTLAASMASAGYAHTWDVRRRLALRELLTTAPPRRAARAALPAQWTAVSVDRAARTVTRPPGVRLDLGATAKGFIADLALCALGPLASGFVDAGGDLAIGGTGTPEVLAADPFDGPPQHLTVHEPCGVATSSIAGRCWRTPQGPAHHLLDPSTGRPAFTGVVQATAAAPNAAAAERLAGQALLAGPQAAPAVLARHGGLLVVDDGTTHRIPGDLLT